MRANLPVKAERIGADLAALAAITEPERPWTRRAFTPMFLKGRAWLEARMIEAGLETRLDAAGNLIGRRKGTGAAPGVLMIGSHSDSVPAGGRFDGMAGVVAGLEIARALQEQGIELAQDLEIVDFLAEEVSIFGVSCVGSRGMTGRLPPEWLTRQAGGRDLAAALKEVGGDPQALTPRADILAFLELHIEQGPVLEADGISIGVVESIAGITRVSVEIPGRPDHAGTTPMTLRDDALLKAADLTLSIWAQATALAKAPGHFTATVGEFAIEPGAANVIPSKARLLIDARASEPPRMEAFLLWLEAQIRREPGAQMRILSDNPPRPSDPEICARLEQAAARLGTPARRMVSGAGHDAAWIGAVAPAAMVFVPCKGGRSHCPEEWAETEDLALGTAVLFETLLDLDRRPPGKPLLEKDQA